MGLVLHKKQDGTYTLSGEFPEYHVFSEGKFIELMGDGVIEGMGEGKYRLKLNNGSAIYNKVEMDPEDRYDHAIALELDTLEELGDNG